MLDLISVGRSNKDMGFSIRGIINFFKSIPTTVDERYMLMHGFRPPYKDRITTSIAHDIKEKGNKSGKKSSFKSKQLAN